MTDYLVYGLLDPRTNEIRYVGLSTTGLKRPREHGKPSQMKMQLPRSCWVRSLRAAGYDYFIIILQRCDSFEALCEAEKDWIAVGRSALGDRLLNLTDGGEGTIGCHPSKESIEKNRAKNTGRKNTPEAIKLMSESRSKYLADPEVRKQISKKQREVWASKELQEKQRRINAEYWTPEVRAEFSLKLKGIKRTPEAKANIATAQRERFRLEREKNNGRCNSRPQRTSK